VQIPDPVQRSFIQHGGIGLAGGRGPIGDILAPIGDILAPIGDILAPIGDILAPIGGAASTTGPAPAAAEPSSAECGTHDSRMQYSCSMVNGLLRYRSMPASKHREASPFRALAVSAMTGVCSRPVRRSHSRKRRVVA